MLLTGGAGYSPHGMRSRADSAHLTQLTCKNESEKKKKRTNEKYRIKQNPKFWPLDGQILNFWPQIRILRKISSLEPAGNV